MGQGSDTHLYTVDLTPTRDWPRLGGWDGPGTTTRHTQHRLITGLASWLDGWAGPEIPYIMYTHLRSNSTAHQDTWSQGATTYPAKGATTLLAHGRVEGTGLGQQSTTRQHNTDSYGSGLMVGWMGRAWKTLLYTLTPIYDKASATSQALVGWQGRAWAIRRNLAVDIGH
ncbi:hypothetical protein AtubIFM54640_008797 [Aspergillus tubingensis]|nr:hypothetical protein AtubIFM54640_008797 [Aspergillus tubingensis]